MDRTIRDLAEGPTAAAAREWLRRHDRDVLAWQRAIAEIPAPTGAEEARGAFLADRFAALGLEGVRRDEAGNIRGRLGPVPGVGVVLAAHLDTVFSPDTDHTVCNVDGRLVGPGICDNARDRKSVV